MSHGESPFFEAKTLFQTNMAYDPRIAIPVDAIILHQHGTPAESIATNMNTWSEKGFPVGRMFFSDSDAGNHYTSGEWDGTPHPDDREVDANGNVCLCGGVRPYMLPTQGWTNYLEEMACASTKAGAQAILPEEPLAHVFSGYETSFRSIWESEYGFPWMPEKQSAEARFLTGQLKNQLYIQLETQLARKARQCGGDTPPMFILPIHSIYSNIAAQLVAPLGTSLEIPADGYIGQVWTGPVNWSLSNYDSQEKSFFCSAYALYDYFVELAAGTNRHLWLLVDPVEDDPNHTWDEFTQWYKHCTVAALMFPNVSGYETMPWPDRIFLPGHSTGGGTPAPDDFRMLILSIVQAMQDIPVEGTNSEKQQNLIGIAVSDSFMWHRHETPKLQGLYGLLMPLLMEGIPASSCILEKAEQPGYLDRFSLIALSYEDYKPPSEKTHEHLANWVRQGGELLLLGNDQDINSEHTWWKREGVNTPLQHLLKTLGLNEDKTGSHKVGKGLIWRDPASPSSYADPGQAKHLISGVLKHLTKQSKRTPEPTGSFLQERGPFVMAYASKKPVRIKGPLVDILDPGLPLRDSVVLRPGQSGLYRRVGNAIRQQTPCVLHSTFRLMKEIKNTKFLSFLIIGPAQTPGAALIFCGDKVPGSISAIDAKTAKAIPAEHKKNGQYIYIKFPNQPEGIQIRIEWQEE